MKAMILAAGEGTRLRPLTLESPKPLLPIGGTPTIEHTLNWLRDHGSTEVAINLYHLGDQIKDYLGDGSRLGVELVYSEEETLLGTSGGVKKMEHFFDGTFIVFYGDTLTDFDLSEMIEFHQQKNASVTVALFEPVDPSQYGIVQMDEAGRILGFIEKPQGPIPGLQSPLLANTGVYVLEKDVLDFVPESSFSDFGYDIFPKMIDVGMPMYGYPLKPGDYFIETGNLEKYEQANADVRRGKVQIGKVPG